MEKNKILEAAQKENNDEFKNKKFQRTRSIGKTSVVIVLAILGIVESIRYENAIYIMLIPVMFMTTIDSIIKVVFKKADKSETIMMWFELTVLILVIVGYILKTWLKLW